MRRLLIEAGPLEIRTALVEDGAPVEFHILDPREQGSLGAVHRGRLLSHEAGLGAFFVGLGQGPNGFLKVKDAPPGASLGQAVTVRVIRAGTERKGPRLSARGLPQEGGPPGLVVPAPSPVLRLAAEAGPDEIVFDGPAAPNGLEARRHAGTTPLFRAAEVEEAFDAALDPVVPLAGGGRLVIDEAEALTAFDVDGAGRSAAAVNLEAVPAIAAEIRRRNLGGQIALDLVRGEPGGLEAARAALKRALAPDPRQPQLVRGDLDGLLLVTRPRTGRSLMEAATLPCPVSTGRWLSPRHLAARLMRDCEAALRQAPGRPLLAQVPPDLLDWLGRAEIFDDWARRLGTPLRLEAGDPYLRDIKVSAR